MAHGTSTVLAFSVRIVLANLYWIHRAYCCIITDTILERPERGARPTGEPRLKYACSITIGTIGSVRDGLLRVHFDQEAAVAVSHPQPYIRQADAKLCNGSLGVVKAMPEAAEVIAALEGRLAELEVLQ